MFVEGEKVGTIWYGSGHLNLQKQSVCWECLQWSYDQKQMKTSCQWTQKTKLQYLECFRGLMDGIS